MDDAAAHKRTVTIERPSTLSVTNLCVHVTVGKLSESADEHYKQSDVYIN